MTHNHLAWDKIFCSTGLTDFESERACNRAKVGAVLVKDNKVIATGYNGSVSGPDHCLEDGCLMVEDIVSDIHAEVSYYELNVEIPKALQLM